MKSAIIRFLWLLFPCVPLLLQAQIPDTLSPDLQNQIERLTEDKETEFDFSEFVEEWEQLARSPVNLNTREPEELRRLFFLNEKQIRSILKHTANYGDFQSIYELRVVEGLDSTVIKQMLPFVVLKTEPADSFSWQESISKGKHHLLLRQQRVLEVQEGYKTPTDSLLQAHPNSFYKGSPDRWLLKYTFDYRGRLRWGIIGEKDPGEEFFKGSQPYGFDFYSAHFFYSGKGRLRRIALGDFHASFGQGLVMWSGIMFGKASMMEGNSTEARGLRPSSSANEFSYLRGGGITLVFNYLNISAFAARNALDGSIVNPDSLSEYIKGLRTTGLHRTEAEIAAKNSVYLNTIGGNLDYTGDIFKAGLTLVSAIFDRDFQHLSELYRLFQQPQKKQFTSGAHFSIYLRNIVLKGELARDTKGHFAGILSSTFQLDPRFSLRLIYRNYDKAFQNFFSNAFSENTGVYNEEGVYLGFKAAISKKMELLGYADYFCFPWFRYRVDAPSKGREYLLRADVHLSPSSLIYLRYRFKQKDINSADPPRPVNVVNPQYFHNFRFHADYRPFHALSLSSRAEILLNHPASGQKQRQGFLVYQELAWTPPATPITLAARYALFDTDTYEERIYAYERDLRFSFSIPAYYYNGQRFYFLIKYSPKPWTDLWIRYSATYYSNTITVGSGPDASQGNSRSEIKAQLLLKF